MRKVFDLCSFNLKYGTQLPGISFLFQTNPSSCKLPFQKFDWNTERSILKEESFFLSQLQVTLQEANDLEFETKSQKEWEDWQTYRKNRITSSISHKIFIRLRNFDTLVSQIINQKNIS